MPAEALRLHITEGEPITDAVGPTTPTPDLATIGIGLVARGLIKLSDLFKLLAVSKSTGHRLLAAGRIGPKPIRLTAGCVRFYIDEIDAWLSTRKQDGNLHDAKSWPAVWAAIQRKR